MPKGDKRYNGPMPSNTRDGRGTDERRAISRAFDEDRDGQPNGVGQGLGAVTRRRRIEEALRDPATIAEIELHDMETGIQPKNGDYGRAVRDMVRFGEHQPSGWSTQTDTSRAALMRPGVIDAKAGRKPKMP